MKKAILTVLLSLLFHFGFSQNWEEWTRQKKTTIKRLMEQIAANKVYIEHAQKGYKIVTDGLHFIRDIKDGDFRLHLGFFDSLRIVNPKIRNSSKVAAIVALQVQIIQSNKKALEAVQESGQFTNAELDYCRKVFDNLLSECSKDIDELFIVITHGEIAMPDDERLQRIDRIYAKMQDKGSFSSSFGNEMSVLAMQRLADQTAINYSKRLNEYQ